MLVDAMTAGEIKSLAGLDDTKVTKGRDNWIRLREIMKKICDPQEAKQLLKRIDEVEIYYQTDFINHLSDKGPHKCNCLTCGFNDKDTPTDILCSHKDQHLPSCEKCTDGFAIISRLLELAASQHRSLQQSFAPRDSTTTTTNNNNNNNTADVFSTAIAAPAASVGTTTNPAVNFSSMSLVLLKKACLERDLIQSGLPAVLVERLDNFETWKQKGGSIKWESFTNDFLKKACKERGIPSSGSKAKLVDGIEKYEEEKAHIARSAIPMRELTHEELVALQSSSEFTHELELRKQDLVEYRSHMARHLSEDAYANEQIQNLKDDEAIVTSDFKMKMLSCYFRENQKKWFGKKGTVDLGFMITTNPEDAESVNKGVKDVTFVMMLTNDGLQDDCMVACAKFWLYNEYLPRHIKKVHFVSDGAGCFKSQLHRSIQDLWEVWTGVKEVTYRLTPAGDGKSPLDGMFGWLNYLLRGAVDTGASYWDAESIANAIASSNGLSSTQFAIFLPERTKHLEVTIAKFNFEAILLTKLDPSRPGGLIAFKHSGYGSGQKIDLVKDVQFSWRTGDTKGKGDETVIEKVYNDDRTKNIATIKTMQPMCSEFNRTENCKSFMTTKLKCSGSGAGLTAVRLKKKRKRNEEAASSKMDEYLLERSKMRDAGIHLCEARCPQTKRFCRNMYQSKKELEKHTKHSFPKGVNARDYLLREASKPGGVVEAGARPDRSSMDLFHEIVAADAGARGEIDAHCFGCFNRKENVVGYKKPRKLLAVLEKLYNEKPQLTAFEMQNRMRGMKDPAAGGLLFCHEKRNTNGTLLSIDQIKSWIGTRTQRKKNAEKHVLTEKDVQEAALLQKLRETSRNVS